MNRRNRTVLVLLVSAALASVASFVVYSAMPVCRSNRWRSRRCTSRSQQSPCRWERCSRSTSSWWAGPRPVPPGKLPVPRQRSRTRPDSAGLRERAADRIEARAARGRRRPAAVDSAGMRAISVKVNEVIGVAGFVVPGHPRRRDGDANGSNSGSMAAGVVSNVQVLTAGTRYDQEQAKDGKPIPSTVVTLLVTPDDGERIALARLRGRSCWRCAIRSTWRRPTTHGCADGGLMGAPAPAAGVKVAAAPAKRSAAKPATAPASPAPKSTASKPSAAPKTHRRVVR